jgi:hypothetical protein
MTRSPVDTSSPEFLARAARRRATWMLARHPDLDAAKAAEYAFWARQPAHVVMAAVSELTAEVYAMKGMHVSRLQRPHSAP